ncbi:MAG: FMN-binding protein [Parcubacteria bacterium C7867-003]|nr:MAG: FMN-binding protein [Parcubacteria bacterium C7867-003]
MPEEKKSSAALTSAIVVLVLAIASYGVFKYVKKDSTSGVPVVTPPTSEPVVLPPVSTSVYKDGTYTVDGSYVSPGGEEKINVTLVLKDDVVVDATVKALATNTVSVKMQTAFASGYKTLVVGKKITDVTLTKVSGSSLTPKGWNDAVAKIQVQAKA